MGPHNLFSLIGERLMLNESTITMPIYNVLFEVIIVIPGCAEFWRIFSLTFTYTCNRINPEADVP